MPAEALTFTAYARRIGVTQPYISQLVAAGVIQLTPERKIDPVLADAALAAHRDPARQSTVERHAMARTAKQHEPAPSAGPVAIQAPGTFQQAKTATETFRAKNAEMEYRTRVGELVERAEYARGLAQNLGPALQRLDTISARLGSRLAAETDVRKIQDILDDDVAAIRQEIADYAQALIDGVPDTRQ